LVANASSPTRAIPPTIWEASPESTTASATIETTSEATSETWSTGGAAKPARAHWSGRNSFRISTTSKASSKSTRFPAFYGTATFDVYLDATVFDANAIAVL
jgi:hypothetical protein